DKIFKYSTAANLPKLVLVAEPGVYALREKGGEEQKLDEAGVVAALTRRPESRSAAGRGGRRRRGWRAGDRGRERRRRGGSPSMTMTAGSRVTRVVTIGRGGATGSSGATGVGGDAYFTHGGAS